MIWVQPLASALDSSCSDGLMFGLGAKAAAIMAVKRPSSNKESCKFSPILGRSHMLAVIRLHSDDLMSPCIFSAII